MRACEGCRRRKIKCDAATTNTWPCSACIRLKLHCVRPNGYDGAAEPQVFEPTRPDYEAAGVQDFRPHLAMPPPHMLAGTPNPASMYAKPATYSEPAGLYQPMQYADGSPVATGMHYTTMPPISVVDHPYVSQAPQSQSQSHTVFPTPPMQQLNRPDSPPESYHQDQYGQQDLSELLGTLKLNDAGTGEFSEPHQEEPKSHWVLTHVCSTVPEPEIEDQDRRRRRTPTPRRGRVQEPTPGPCFWTWSQDPHSARADAR